VEGDGGVPDVGSVAAVPRLRCETRLFITFWFHVWSYSIVSTHGGGLALLKVSLLDRGKDGQTDPAMLVVKWGSRPKACGFERAYVKELSFLGPVIPCEYCVQ
jgi:hypothetical protein